MILITTQIFRSGSSSKLETTHQKCGYMIITYIYIYIYKYILLSTDRLFRSITTLQCGETRRTFQGGIETCPTLR